MSSNSAILILVFVVLALLAILLARRWKPLSPAQRWALAASGNLGATWNDRFDNLARAIHTAGWMDEATAWNHIAFAARRLQSTYGS